MEPDKLREHLTRRMDAAMAPVRLSAQAAAEREKLFDHTITWVPGDGAFDTGWLDRPVAMLGEHLNLQADGEPAEATCEQFLTAERVTIAYWKEACRRLDALRGSGASLGMICPDHALDGTRCFPLDNGE